MSRDRGERREHSLKVYMKPSQAKRAGVLAKLLGFRGFSTLVREIVRLLLESPLMLLKFAVEYVFGPYDWRESWKVVREETLDRDEMKLNFGCMETEELSEFIGKLEFILDHAKEEAENREE